MTIMIWQSYACNNSSSYRLVARFADAATATDVARELSELFKVHAAELDALDDFPDDNPGTARALAEKYGFAWTDILYWGDGKLVGDEPTLAAEGNVLALYHTKCGDLGDLRTYVEKRGGKVDAASEMPPAISVLFAWPADADELAAAWADLAAQIGEGNDTADEIEFEAPWGGRRRSAQVAAFRDASSGGLYCPIDPGEVDALKTWLADKGVRSPSITLCEYGDAMTFSGVATARCTACGGPLLYLDPRIHDIEKSQLQCTPCGGLYDLQAFPPKRG